MKIEIPFKGFDFSQFWDDDEYALEEYVSEPPTDELIVEIEQELGYKLPNSYIWLMKQHNGGIPFHTNHPTNEPTSWAEDHIAITGIMGIGRDKRYSLGGEFGSRFWIEDWEYPDIGVAICNCPSAGHDMIFLDYRECGPKGEPKVVHVDQESDYEITFVADNFERFIRGLVNDDVYDTSEEDKIETLQMIATGKFSSLLTELCANVDKSLSIEQKIREIARQITEEKGFFALHADELSTLLYDIQFWLFTNTYPDTSETQYVEKYSEIIAFGGEFSTGGYAPSFITDWLAKRMEEGKIITSSNRICMTEQTKIDLVEKLREY